MAIFVIGTVCSVAAYGAISHLCNKVDRISRETEVFHRENYHSDITAEMNAK